jgi:hypothetical protein
MAKAGKGLKALECRKSCGNTSIVSEEATAVTCWRCVQKELNGIKDSTYKPMSEEDFKEYVNK